VKSPSSNGGRQTKTDPAQFNQQPSRSGSKTTKDEEWRQKILSQQELFMELYSHLPKELIFQRELLMARL
jgi:hypothetical protein